MVKRQKGQYFTKGNPFINDGFKKWADGCRLNNNIILEPFAGSNNLIYMLKDMGYCFDYVSYDIDPKDTDVSYKDTLLDFPKGFNICITNPPYLAKNSAKRRGLDYPSTNYDDLYKYALSKCLENCNYVAAIIPASFLNSKLFRGRLSCYILLNSKMFSDTDCPVCLALFVEKSDDVDIYYDDEYIGKLSEKEQILKDVDLFVNIKFNDPYGQIGLIAVDGTKENSIRFCDGNFIESNSVSNSSRSITRLSINGVDYNKEETIKLLNNKLDNYRKETKDIFMTPFKGLRKDGMYRRRLDYGLAKILIKNVLKEEFLC